MPELQWQPWETDNQVGGYITTWTTPAGHSFAFATVYGAGHMVRESCTAHPCQDQCVTHAGRFSWQVPKDKPAKALALFGMASHGRHFPSFCCTPSRGNFVVSMQRIILRTTRRL